MQSLSSLEKGIYKSSTLDWTRELDYGLDYRLSLGLSRLMLPDVSTSNSGQL